MDNGKYVDTILSEEGVKQGDTLGSLLFALSMQRLYRRCKEGIPGVTCVAVADDLNIFGSPESVSRASPSLTSPYPTVAWRSGRRSAVF